MMEKAIRRYRLGYILGISFCVIGLMALLMLIMNAWPETSASSDPFSAFWTYLWAGQFSLFSAVEFKPLYLLILATIMLSSATAIFFFSRQKFLLPGKTIRLQCPFCKKHWHARYDRGQVLCPHCQHLVHPKMALE